MRIRTLLALATLTLASAATAFPAEVAAFGESLSPDLEVTPIASILAEPAAWAGKQVRIAGEVSGVCAMKGCWIDLVSSDNAKLRVKVDDGVIVFPAEAAGHSAVAEGTVELVKMDKTRYEAWMRHVADEEDRPFDPTEIGEGPYRLVRLRGAGVEIEGL